MTFGKKLQELRKEHKVSQEELAESINVSRQAVSKWENGTVIPDTENLLLVCKYFDVSIESLLSEETETLRMPLSDNSEDKPSKTRIAHKHNGKYFLICGGGAILMAVCFTYPIKYMDFKTNGSCYTNAIQYLFSFPLVIVFSAGVILLFIAFIQLFQKN